MPRQSISSSNSIKGYEAYNYTFHDFFDVLSYVCKTKKTPTQMTELKGVYPIFHLKFLDRIGYQQHEKDRTLNSAVLFYTKIYASVFVNFPQTQLDSVLTPA